MTINITYTNYKSGCPHQALFQWGNHTEFWFHHQYCWELKSRTPRSHHYYLHNYQLALGTHKTT